MFPKNSNKRAWVGSQLDYKGQVVEDTDKQSRGVTL